MRERNLQIPLPLAELLFVTLGPLAEILEVEGHRWVPVIKMVLRAYRDGRDDIIKQMYGAAMIDEIDIVTLRVSEQLANWVQDMALVEEDFDKWGKELGDG